MKRNHLISFLQLSVFIFTFSSVTYADGTPLTLKEVMIEFKCPEGTTLKNSSSTFTSSEKSFCVNNETDKPEGFVKLKNRHGLTLFQEYKSGTNLTRSVAALKHRDDGSIKELTFFPNTSANPTKKMVTLDESGIEEFFAEKLPLLNASLPKEELPFDGCVKDVGNYITCPEGQYKYVGPNLGVEVINSSRSRNRNRKSEDSPPDRGTESSIRDI